MSTKNQDLCAKFFRDCPGLSTDAKIAWMAMADVASARTHNVCYLGEKALCAKLGWGRHRLHGAAFELVQAGRIRKEGTWMGGGGRFHSVVLWVAPFADMTATPPPRADTIYLPPHGIVRLAARGNENLRVNLWKQHGAKKGRMLEAEFTKVPESTVVENSTSAPTTTAPAAEDPSTVVQFSTTEDSIEALKIEEMGATVVENPSSNILIREGMIRDQEIPPPVSERPYIVPPECKDGHLQGWGRVLRFLEANGCPDAFGFGQWRKAVEGEGVLTMDQLPDWTALAWGLAQSNRLTPA